VSYEVQGEQYIALAMNHRVWAFKAGGTVPPLPAPPAPPTAIQWEGRLEDASAVQLGVTATYNVVTAGRREEWNNEDGISPPRVRTKTGAMLTFKNGTKTARTIESRDGSWTTGVIKPGESAAVAVAKPGTYEYICKERPWSFGQLVVE
jgi:alcohol dehydrogenase (cytochrome c)